MSLWKFIRLVRFHGGRNHYLTWHPEGSLPIVVMSPNAKLTNRADFALVRRSLGMMQYHPHTARCAEYTQRGDSAHTQLATLACRRPWCPGTQGTGPRDPREVQLRRPAPGLRATRLT